MKRSGDGFVTAADGSPRWGIFGAAGILVRHVHPDDANADDPSYFLARRSMHTHLGGTWAIPGGALDQGETPLEGALREFVEEIGVALDEHGYEVVEQYEDDHGGWSYWTLVVDVPEPFEAPATLTWETSEARWVRRSELGELELFGAFRATLDRLGLG
ncbi:MAG TPA: NUDIX hydrolase [Acidimicrobiales bacterium]|nr:NUDIX hydrolase [Acidimicrobiales bacterium]